MEATPQQLSAKKQKVLSSAEKANDENSNLLDSVVDVLCSRHGSPLNDHLDLVSLYMMMRTSRAFRRLGKSIAKDRLKNSRFSIQINPLDYFHGPSHKTLEGYQTRTGQSVSYEKTLERFNDSARRENTPEDYRHIGEKLLQPKKDPRVSGDDALVCRFESAEKFGKKEDQWPNNEPKNPRMSLHWHPLPQDCVRDESTNSKLFEKDNKEDAPFELVPAVYEKSTKDISVCLGIFCIDDSGLGRRSSSSWCNGCASCYQYRDRGQVYRTGALPEISLEYEVLKTEKEHVHYVGHGSCIVNVMNGRVTKLRLPFSALLRVQAAQLAGLLRRRDSKLSYAHRMKKMQGPTARIPPWLDRDEQSLECERTLLKELYSILWSEQIKVLHSKYDFMKICSWVSSKKNGGLN